MIDFFNKDGSMRSMVSLEELFNSENRKDRNELFGSYLCKSYLPETILTNVDIKIKEINHQLSNLEQLKVELQKHIDEKNAKELQERVDKMSKEEALALMEKLKTKLGQI